MYVDAPYSEQLVGWLKALPKQDRKWDAKLMLWHVRAWHVRVARRAVRDAAREAGGMFLDYTRRRRPVYGLDVKRELDRCFAALEMLVGPGSAMRLAKGASRLGWNGSGYDVLDVAEKGVD